MSLSNRLQTPCWLSRIGAVKDECDYSPTHRPDQMHIAFRENYLSKAPTGPRLSKDEANDPRIIRDGCRKHHHQMDFGDLSLTREQLPSSVEAFAEAYGLQARLDRDFPQTKEGGDVD